MQTIVMLCLSCSGDHKQKFYWGHKEILLPVYKNMSDAMKKHPEVDVLISFASLRSAYDSTMETLQFPQVGARRFWELMTCHLLAFLFFMFFLLLLFLLLYLLDLQNLDMHSWQIKQ